MKKITFVLLASSLIFFSCNSFSKDSKKLSEKNEKNDTLTEHTIDPGLLVNRIDPICGMSTIKDMSDTTTYKGNILGFCSSECKAEFMKKPEDFIAKAEIKVP